jgi:hypothetical protein
MKLTRTHLVAVAAALSTIAVAAPVATASADTAGSAVTPAGIAATGWDGTPAAAFPVTLPGAGQAAAVVGPTIITTAPTTFINTNNQVTAGSSVSGGQLAG